jgi:hypothetical protein
LKFFSNPDKKRPMPAAADAADTGGQNHDQVETFSFKKRNAGC